MQHHRQDDGESWKFMKIHGIVMMNHGKRAPGQPWTRFEHFQTTTSAPSCTTTRRPPKPFQAQLMTKSEKSPQIKQSSPKRKVRLEATLGKVCATFGFKWHHCGTASSARLYGIHDRKTPQSPSKSSSCPKVKKVLK